MGLDALGQAFLKVDADLLDQYKRICLRNQVDADDMNLRRKKLMEEARLAENTEVHRLMRELTPSPYFAITLCRYEGELGLSHYKIGAGRRWACKTCWNFAAPVWSTNEKKCPSPDDALHEYVKWSGKLGKTSDFLPWKKGIHGHDIR
jgi:hypothetical protein